MDIMHKGFVSYLTEIYIYGNFIQGIFLLSLVFFRFENIYLDIMRTEISI